MSDEDEVVYEIEGHTCQGASQLLQMSRLDENPYATTSYTLCVTVQKKAQSELQGGCPVGGMK